MTAFAATPGPTSSAIVAETPGTAEATETPGAPEATEANEPALPGGGHDDGNANANADNQFDGVQ